MRKTKIICTIGPASDNEETLIKMAEAGMNVARANFSHGDYAQHQRRFDLIKKVREELNLPIAILLDTKGPEYRIGLFENDEVTLKAGDKFTFTTQQITGNQEKVSVSYKRLCEELEVGDPILVNNGLVRFVVKEIKGCDIICDVEVGGKLSNRKSMSFPSKHLKQEFLSEVDKQDLLFGIKNGLHAGEVGRVGAHAHPETGAYRTDARRLGQDRRGTHRGDVPFGAGNLRLRCAELCAGERRSFRAGRARGVVRTRPAEARQGVPAICRDV